MYMIFNKDGDFKLAAESLVGLLEMIEDEELVVKKIEYFKPEEYIYSLTESGEVASEEYTIEAPPEI